MEGEDERGARGDADRMRAVALAGARLVSARTPADFAAVLREACGRVMPLDAFEVAIHDEAAGTLRFSGGLDLGTPVPPAVVRVRGTPSEAVIRERRSVVVGRASDPGAAGATLVGTGRRSESVIRTPIVAGARVLGLVSVHSDTPELYDARDVEVLETLAALAATALLNIEHLAERERLLAERDGLLGELRAERERLRLALGAADMVIWERDLATGALIDREAAPGSPGRAGAPRDFAGLLAAVHPDDRERVEQANARSVATGEELDVEYRLVLPDGRVRWQHATGVVIPDERGRPARVLGVGADVTERRLLEDQLRHAQKLEAVGRLAGGVAHDFNNLLTAISISLELVRDALADTLPPGHAAAVAAAGDLEEATRAAARASDLTRQLLAFSRRQVLRPERLDVNAVVRAAERIIRRLLPENVVVDNGLAWDLWPVLADAGQLEQALMNLAVNARDAMPHGGILCIETANEVLDGASPEARPGDYVRLTVSDNGQGMDAATLARVFEPFFTTKGVGHGTGLGLATVHGIVTQSGGFVRAESEPGHGSAFHLYLPRAAGAGDAAGAAPGGAPAPAREDALRGTECVLLVEDERSVRAAARRMLERRGYRVLEARHGGDALYAWQAAGGAVDVVLTDVRMPEMDGVALAAELRARVPDLPIVFMSGYADDPTMLGGEAFVEKPFLGEALLGAVRRALDGGPRADG